MPEVISISEFLKLSESIPVLDARSPGEFLQGHIPGALSFPLLNNEERAEVGITFKKSGKDFAVIKGFDLVGSKFGAFIRSARKISPSRKVLVYCWRGGLRSNIMSWVLGLGGFDVFLLEGGYKTFRNYALQELNQTRQIIILAGKTGSGKTELLSEIGRFGEQVIDLERLANHRGSAFGSMGLGPQPTTEQFENELAIKWSKLDPERPVWLENESRMTGTVKIPDFVFQLMKESPVLEVNVSREYRMKRILDEYGVFPVNQLIENTSKLQKRLGHKRMDEAITFLYLNDYLNWVKIVLDYYDEKYSYGMSLRNPEKTISIDIDSQDYVLQAENLIKAYLLKANEN